MKYALPISKTLALIASMLLMLPLTCYASDHIDFPGGLKQTVVPGRVDLADLYAWVPEKGKLVLALNTFMHPANADPAPEFDGSVEYRFDIRKVKLRKPTEIKVTPAITSTETTGSIPVATRDSLLRIPAVQRDFSANVTCKPIGNVPNCRVKVVRAGQSASKNTSVLNYLLNIVRASQPELKTIDRAVAGQKADPFMLDAIWAQIRMRGVIDPNVPPAEPVPLPDAVRLPIAERVGLPQARNASDVFNVLNLTLEIDIADVLGEDTELIAVAGEAFTEEAGHPQRRDRVGRPEITNLTIGLAGVKTAYNKAPTFNLSPEQIENNKALIRYGVLGWDRQDGKNDWPHGGELHDLLDILVLDALVVDTTKTCDFAEQSFLAVERGQGQHTSCGGRVPNEDIVDTLFSFYTAGIESSNDAYGDGADRAARQPQDVWPYFVTP